VNIRGARAVLATLILVFPFFVGPAAYAADPVPQGTMTGRYTDSAGQPFADAQVLLFSADGADSRGTSTDGNGMWSVPVNADTAYVVQVSVPDYPTMYVPGTLYREKAQQFTVAAGHTVVIDDAMPATGSVSGTYKKADGSANPGVSVMVRPDDGTGTPLSAITDAGGQWAVPHVVPGDNYVVSFSPDAGSVPQYYRSRLTWEASDRLTVVAGQNTVADDSQLPTAAVAVTATDAQSGQPIAAFCAVIVNEAAEVCTTNGTVTITNVRVGPQTLNVYDDNGRYVGVYDRRVTVTTGPNPVAVTLQRGATISTQVTDARTGKGIPNICVAEMAPTDNVPPDGFGSCSDSTGTIHIGPINGGTYNLWAVDFSGAYGAQWVGPSGGVGTQELAAKLTVAAGQEIKPGSIRMDPAVSITGTVTDPAGHPVANATVSTSTVSPGPGPTSPNAVTDAAGKYQITGVGPYQWPLFFSGWSGASQWSGNVSNRLQAHLVTGGSAYDQKLVTGVRVGGYLRHADGSPYTAGRVTAVDAGTAEPLGSYDVYTASGAGHWSIWALPTTKLKFAFDDEVHNEAFWYGGTTFTDAKVVPVPRQNLTLNLSF
jgi:hypothetical protein